MDESERETTSPPHRRHLVRRLVAVTLALLAVAALTGYAYASNSVFDQATTLTRGWCDATFGANTPSSFRTDIDPTVPKVDTSPYLMPEYETVSIPSRDPGITLSAWWIPAHEATPGVAEPPTTRAVLLTHGRDKCKRDPQVLLPAGMLSKAGFSVLLIDVRNHGGSSDYDGRRFTWGATEYPDVLGAWDWLRTVQGIPASGIGLYGVSFGAATSTIAMGHEPGVAAVFEDSGWADTDQMFRDLLRSRGYPEFLEPGAVAVGRLFHGVDLIGMTPAAAVGHLDGRPYYIVHGDADSSILVSQAYALADAVRAGGGRVEPWIVHGANHVRSAFVATAEYERRLVEFFKNALH